MSKKDSAPSRARRPPQAATEQATAPARTPSRRDDVPELGRSYQRFDGEDDKAFLGGWHHALHHRLGAQPVTERGTKGVRFTVWAPHAERVSVVGDFNGWDPAADPMEPRTSAGLWSTFVPQVPDGSLYKFHIVSQIDGYTVDKADPLAFRAEPAPRTASRTVDLSYEWGDADWMARRRRDAFLEEPMSIYEVHLGSWKREAESPDRISGYAEATDELVRYVVEMGFTHVELMPVTEHPYYGSWGYQTTGYFAATSRYGEPHQLMRLIDRLHQQGVGVILDWVPSHFPGDEHGLGFFDGTRLYEYADPRLGYHPDWHSYVFDYGSGEVRSFLISSAVHWVERFHVDALRVDAVASMLYLDYSRQPDQSLKNSEGGRENLEAIEFIKRLNDTLHVLHPGVQVIAEESTAWAGCCRDTNVGGLGFQMKWDMGWMHDTLEYFRINPIHRKFHHNKITFRMMYAYSENFVLALSHDEVVHGKSSLVGKMWGDRWNQFANLRALFGYMYSLPGKKLLFMGAELGQWQEWSHERGLDWDLLTYPFHSGLQQWVRDLNHAYREQPALHRFDFDPRGFRWIDCSDVEQSVLCFERHADEKSPPVVVVCNLTPEPREHYRIGVPRGGHWRELLNSDARTYGGSGIGNLGSVEAVAMRYHDRPWSIELTLPPQSVMFLAPTADSTAEKPRRKKRTKGSRRSARRTRST